MSFNKAVAILILTGFYLAFCLGCSFLAYGVYLAMEQGWGL